MSSNKCKNCCFCLVTAVYLLSAVRFYLTCRWQRVSNERSLSRLLALSLGGRLVCLSLSDVLLPRRPANFGSTLQIERKSCSYCRTFLFFNKNTKQDRQKKNYKKEKALFKNKKYITLTVIFNRYLLSGGTMMSLRRQKPIFKHFSILALLVPSSMFFFKWDFG